MKNFKTFNQFVNENFEVNEAKNEKKFDPSKRVSRFIKAINKGAAMVKKGEAGENFSNLEDIPMWHFKLNPTQGFINYYDARINNAKGKIDKNSKDLFSMIIKALESAKDVILITQEAIESAKTGNNIDSYENKIISAYKDAISYQEDFYDTYEKSEDKITTQHNYISNYDIQLSGLASYFDKPTYGQLRGEYTAL